LRFKTELRRIDPGFPKQHFFTCVCCTAAG
jgi:hypothetical protein